MTTAGRFGIYGGAFVPETLVPALEELEAAMNEALADPAFIAELDGWLYDYAGRPTPLTLARRLTEACGGAQIWLKREDLVHTGAHKLNNALGQVLLARRMGKTRIIAETGAGQHGVATATVCACFGLECVVYMGREDIRRQALNVYKMGLLGAEVRPVDSGSRTLKDATNEAIRDWVTNVENTHYVIGSVVGPHPYPTLVKRFQRVIGDEARQQALQRWGTLPDSVVACVGGGSNAIGIFTAFLEDEDVDLVGVEAAGRGIETGEHAASLEAGRPGVLHGAYSYLLQDANGQVRETHSISAGLDYPGVGPEHAALRDAERARYVTCTDGEALRSFHRLCRMEGIIPALESSHALAVAERLARELGPDHRVLVCLSGRGDKDIDTVRAVSGTPEGEVVTAVSAGRFEAAFAARGAADRPGIIPYVTAGFPGPGDTPLLLLACQRAGSLAAEVGIPFSDPLADGPTIQSAGWRALAQGMTPARAISQVAQARDAGLTIPVAAMTYINPVLAMGVEAFAAACAAAGIDGVIVPDLPVEEAAGLAASLGAHGLAHIPLVAPTTPTSRVARVAATAAGFVYCVSVTGTTGARESVSPAALDLLERVRSVTALPRALGFGISRPEHLEALAGHCEAVVVGSALLDAIASGEDDPGATAERFVRELRGMGTAGRPPR